MRILAWSRAWFAAPAMALCLASFALAQGVQTGELGGVVRTEDGLVVPGATVTVKSAALQGTRQAVTDAGGAYSFRGLPNGAYTVTFELNGMTTVQHKATITVGGVARVDATLQIRSVQETIVVEAEASNILSTTQVGANYEASTINRLPTARTLASIAELAPNLTNDTPNSQQVTIAGSFAYDNVFLIDGVDVNDNLFGSPDNLFIEDAIDETQVLTSGISAEYGRFSGGVINAVTKRGGNAFSGSFRTTFTNPDWTSRTPFEKSNDTQHVSKTNAAYEGTLGGPIVRDRLWFFLAGRKADRDTDRVFPDTGVPTVVTQGNERGQVKLTGTIATNHTLSGTYMNNSTDQEQPSFGFSSSGLRSIDPFTIDARSLPNSLFVANYTGVLRADLFLEAQYSQKKFKFEDSGGTGRDIVDDSPFLTVGETVPFFGHYNAPYFDANDPENRNNRQIAASLSYALTTRNLGRHDLKAGFENFRSTRTGGNSQSPTDYVFYADYATDAAGHPQTDASGHIVPDFVPGVSFVTLYLAQRGATLDVTTNSFYLNDRWQIGRRLVANLGVRYERVRSEATGGLVGVDTDTIVPRVALSFDPKGDGRYHLEATYAHYAGKYNETQIGNNTNVGNPDYISSLYTGPAGRGRSFAPGFDRANYSVPFLGVFPTANVIFEDGLSSPITKEFTASAKAAIGQRGSYLAVTYTHRKMTNFIEDFVTIDGGQTTIVRNGINFGTFDNKVYRNSDGPRRGYDGLSFQGAYRPSPAWNLYANYTLQINNDGDFVGELRNQPAQQSLFGDYPEILVPDRDFPDGRLPSFQRHKLRAWTSYDLRLGKLGALESSLLWRYDSALTYSLTANSVPLSAIQKSRDPGYAAPPVNQALFFGPRGSQFFAGSHKLDLGFTWNVPVYKKVTPWVKFAVVNVLNNDKLTSWNTTITADPTSPLDANGLPTGYIRGSRFGQATSNANFPLSFLSDATAVNARAFELALGLRF